MKIVFAGVSLRLKFGVEHLGQIVKTLTGSNITRLWKNINAGRRPSSLASKSESFWEDSVVLT